jgi:hypothetical protein
VSEPGLGTRRIVAAGEVSSTAEASDTMAERREPEGRRGPGPSGDPDEGRSERQGERRRDERRQLEVPVERNRRSGYERRSGGERRKGEAPPAEE